MLDMEPIKNFSIDKSGWKKVKFGDVVFEPKESVKDPVTEGIEHVVGLEHIDSEDIHLRRSASIEESTTFTKKFSKGDVLFGRRRAYLKKAATASFEGICSGDITVMRAREELLLPDLLPFIVNNDKFFDYAITHSAGGLSPRVKFKDLALFEFSIPSYEIQEEIYSLLKQNIDIDEADILVRMKLIELKKALSKQYFKLYRKSALRIDTLVEKVGSGVTPKGGSKVYQESGVLFIRSQNVLSGTFDTSDIAYISNEIDNKMKTSRVQNGDVLLNITGASIGRAAVYVGEEKANVNQHVCIIRPKPNELDSDFLCEFFNSAYGQQQVQLLQAGGNREGLNFSNIRAMRVPEYTYTQQLKIKEKFNLVNSNLERLDKEVSARKKFNSGLLNKVF